MSFLSRLFRRYPKLSRSVEGGSQTFSATAWSVQLPLGWEPLPQSDSAVSLETTDKTKGLNITTLQFGQNASLKAPDIAKQLIEVSRAGLAAMDGYKWTFLQDEQQQTSNGCVAVLDAHDAERGYRICSKVVVELPIALRAAFHDYGCESLTESQSYFAAPIESLRVSGARA